MTRHRKTIEVRNEESPGYMPLHINIVNVVPDDMLLDPALLGRIANAAARKLSNMPALANPARTRELLHAKMHTIEHEVFGVLVLNSQHMVIRDVELFRGTIDGASVYPREVVKEVLEANGAAVILYHNHPSGIAEPSQADRAITKRLTEALALIDVRVLDHIVVGASTTISFAERGLL